MENHAEEVFAITVSQKGKSNIQKLSGITTVLLILGCLTSLIFLTNAVIRTVYVDQERYRSNKLLYFEMKSHIYYALLHAGLFISQMCCYLYFVRKSNKSLKIHDNEDFNHSFSYLYKANVLAVLGFALNLIIGFIDLTLDFDLILAHH